MNTTTARMSGDEAALWTAISTFEIDGPDSHLTFAARLARENGWAPAYTQRVLGEYRKFLFLCCVSATGVTPSDPVDQAWHLHLTYTRSYWIDLCRNTLGRDLHHNPTKGGAAEGRKFNGMYTDTQTLYERYFGETPPPDIWHPNAERFSDIDFQRVNRRTNWVIPKPGWVQLAPLGRGRPIRPVALLLGLVALFFVQANGGSLFLILLIGGGLFTWLLVAIANSDWSSLQQPGRRDNRDGGGGAVFMGGDSGSHDGHDGDGHEGDGHGGDSADGGDGSSGCSASGCSSGCSGCGGCGS